MASGTINLTSNNSQWKARLVWSSTPNQTYNYSTLSCRYQVYRDVAGTVSNAAAYWGYANWNGDGGAHGENEYYFPGDKNISVSARTWTTVESWSWTVYHTAAGTRSINMWGMLSSSSFEAEFGQWITLDTIPKAASLTAAPNFNDEQNPTITYSNPAGNNVDSLQVCISLTGSSDDIKYRDIPKTGTSYTFSLTEAERDVLRKATLSGSDTRTVNFTLKTEVGGTTYRSTLTKNFTVINAKPEVSAYWWDSDAACVALTNDNEVFIKGYSNLSYMLSATPKKHATVTKYTSTVDYTHTSTTPMDGNQDPHWNIVKDKITLTATDNRGLVGKMESPIYMIDYFPPTCGFSASNIELDEESGITASAHVEVSGEFFNSKFGDKGVQNQLKIEILHTGLDDWFELPDILWGDGVNGNTYKASFDVNGLDYQKTITFQFRVSDKLVSNITTEEKTLKLFPVFDWSDTDFNFNVPISIQGNMMNDFVIETGTESMGSNGTWYWSKWASGRAECYGIRNYGNMALSTAWGTLFTSADFQQNLPSNLFISAPVANINIVKTDSGGCWVSTQGQSSASATQTGKFIVCRPTSFTAQQVYIGFHCIGRWK